MPGKPVLVGQTRERFLRLLDAKHTVKQAARLTPVARSTVYLTRRHDVELDERVAARVTELWAEWRASKAAVSERRDRHLLNAIRVWGPVLVGYNERQRTVRRVAHARGGLSEDVG
jgi:hypothetical protein